MSEFIYDSHYRREFEMGKPDGLCRHSEEVKSAMNIYFFNEGQLRDLENDDVVEEEDAEYVEVEEIDVAI